MSTSIQPASSRLQTVFPQYKATNFALHPLRVGMGFRKVEVLEDTQAPTTREHKAHPVARVVAMIFALTVFLPITAIGLIAFSASKAQKESYRQYCKLAERSLPNPNRASPPRPTRSRQAHPVPRAEKSAAIRPRRNPSTAPRRVVSHTASTRRPPVVRPAASNRGSGQIYQKIRQGILLVKPWLDNLTPADRQQQIANFMNEKRLAFIPYVLIGAIRGELSRNTPLPEYYIDHFATLGAWLQNSDSAQHLAEYARLALVLERNLNRLSPQQSGRCQALLGQAKALLKPIIENNAELGLNIITQNSSVIELLKMKKPTRAMTERLRKDQQLANKVAGGIMKSAGRETFVGESTTAFFKNVMRYTTSGIDVAKEAEGSNAHLADYVKDIADNHPDPDADKVRLARVRPARKLLLLGETRSGKRSPILERYFPPGQR